MRILIVIFITLLSTSWAKAQDVVFNNVYDFGTAEADAGVVVYDSGYFVTAGGPFINTYKAIIGKIDLTGNMLNSSLLSIDSFGASVGRGKSIEYSNDLVKAVGFFNDSITTRPFIFVLNKNLNVVWYDTILTKGSNYAVTSDSVGDIITCGWHGTSNGDNQFFLLKYRQDGSRVFNKTFGHPSKNEKAYSVSVAPDGGYVMSGYRSNGNGDSNPYILKTDSNGNGIWQREFLLSEYSEDAGTNLISKDGFIYMVSTKGYSKTNYTNSLTWVCKLNQDGQTIWENEFGVTPDILSMTCIAERQDGSILVAGNTTRMDNRNPLAKMRGVVYNIDTAGNQIFEQYFVINPDPAHDSTSDEVHYVRSIDITPDGGYIISGFVTKSSGQDLWVVKFDSNGCYDPIFGGCVVGVEEYSDPSFQLSVWPNPASGLLHIETDSPILEVEVYSQLGELVSSNELVVGSKLEKLDVSEFKPGLYFLVVKTEKGVETKKVLIQH